MKLLRVEQKIVEISNNLISSSEIHNALELELIDKSNTVLNIESDKQFELIVKALSSETRRRILYLIQQSEKGMDVSEIANCFKSPKNKNETMSEANISAQIKKLQDAGLIECNYCSGEHGVRKISTLRFSEIFIKF